MNRKPSLSSRARALSLTAFVLASTLAASAQAPAKKKVTSDADLPRFSYPLTGSASDLLQADDPTFNAFAAKVLADVDSVLTGYDIADKSTLRSLYSVKLQVEELTGKDHEALATVDTLTTLQEKPEARATSGLFARAILQARLTSHATSGPEYEAEYRKNLSAAVATLDWATVQDTMKSIKGSTELVTPSLILGSVKSNLDPAVLQSKGLDFAGAGALIGQRAYLTVRLPLKQATLAVLTPYIAAHTVTKPDIWEAREVTLTADQKLTPVRIGIWDSGVDTALYPSQLFTDPAPGKHSPHGLAYDTHGELYNGDLQPLTQAQKDAYPTIIGLFQGLDDLQANIDSPAASETKKKLAAMPPDQIAPLLKQFNFFGQWMHGTHVAGIAVRGNPAARLVVAQFNDGLPDLPFAPTLEWANKFKADFQQIGDYFRTNNVRVVNMSWGDDVGEIERWLTKTSAEKDPAARKQFAAQIYAIWREAVTNAITSAPNTLFICAAGNSNSNAGFTETVPAALHLPNLVAVGAVDQAGEETSFTSYGDTVKVDADGFQVESYVPGGTKMKESGTSMASPNVVNLAAKLFALDPSLTPEQALSLIEKAANTSPDGRRHLINPKATVALLSQTRTAAGTQ